MVMYAIIRQYIKNITPGKVISKNVNNLGRWSLLECEKSVNERIDRSNHDHCGPCGINVKIKLPKDVTNENKI